MIIVLNILSLSVCIISDKQEQIIEILERLSNPAFTCRIALPQKSGFTSMDWLIGALIDWLIYMYNAFITVVYPHGFIMLLLL